MTTLAGTIVNNVRDEVPDPCYDATGLIPQPDANGPLFRASTLYRWLDTGVKTAARLCGTVVEDWFAFPQVAYQPWYALGSFLKLNSAVASLWPIDIITIVEEDVIWPSRSLAVSQSLWGYQRRRTDHLEFGLWPVPSVTDPTTTLVGALAISGVDPIPLVSTAGFLPYGYVQIDSEILQYQRLATGPTAIQTISRGQCGTTAVAHLAGATVQHLALWTKGDRTPAPIVSSASIVELPDDIATLLSTYLLGRCRRSENEHAEARSLMQDFEKACLQVNADPTRKENRGQIRAFGEPSFGPLAWNGAVVRP